MSLDQATKPLQEAGSVGEHPVIDAHVVLLNNYVRPHHVVSYRELAKRVRKLTVLLSVAMEADRDWEAEWQDLDVRVQKNWTWTTSWRNAKGFNEPNYIHFPVDTFSQLRDLKPDIVFSYEMGMRTLLSSCYRRFHPRVPLVMVGNMADHIETDRGILRRSFRWLIKRSVDYFTYNGPSCRTYLKRLSIPDDRLFHVPYCIDPDAVYRGQRKLGNEEGAPRRLLYVGAISQRKGIVPFVEALKRWCQANSNQQAILTIAGSGEQQSAVRAVASENLTIEYLGNCDCAGLREAYGQTDICVFPTLADEWGLVPIEAMASGVPVLGSVLAQSVETEVQDGANGWVFDPTKSGSTDNAIARAMNSTAEQLNTMGRHAQSSVEHISASATAEKFVNVIENVLPNER